MGKVRDLIERAKEVMAQHPKGLALDDQGQFYPDPRPMQPPVGYKRQPNMWDIVREQVKRISEDAGREGFDTIEEANDFYMGDDDEPYSGYEVEEEREVPFAVLRQREKEAAEAEKKAADAAKAPAPQQPPGEPVKTA